MKLKTALRHAPPAPPCFSDQYQWANYLIGCQDAAKKVDSAPFDTSNDYRPRFNFCADCDASHATAMQGAGKCLPHMHRNYIPIKEVACN